MLLLHFRSAACVPVRVASPARHGDRPLPPSSLLWAQQIARLRSELDIVRGNTKVMSEMLAEMVPGQEDSSDLELLQVRGLLGLWAQGCSC